MLALGALLLAGCADTYQVAARVDDDELGYDELQDEAEAWAASPDFVTAVTGAAPPAGAAPGTAPAGLVVTILNVRLQSEMASRTLSEAGEQVDPQLVSSLRSELDGLAPGFDDGMRDEVAGMFGPIIQLQSLGGAPEPLPADEVYVSSRIGRYDPSTGQIVPADGPLPQPTTPEALLEQ